MDLSKLEYPLIYCAEHPGVLEPGYMKCDHVTKPSEVVYFEKADKDTLGVISCEVCSNRSEDRDYIMKNFNVCCAQGLREAGFLLEIQ